MGTILSNIKEINAIGKMIVDNKDDIFKEFTELLLNNQVDEVVFVGSGTSRFAGMTVKPFMESIMNVRTSALFPNNFIEQAKFYGKNTLVIGISQSGNSLSTFNALKLANELGYHTMALSTDKEASVSTEADAFVPLLCGEEKAAAKTKGYSSCVITMFAAISEYALQKGLLSEKEYDETIVELNKTLDNIPQIISQTEAWLNDNMDELSQADSIIVVGSSKDMGTLMESSLKLLEAIRIPVIGVELEEFMHGLFMTITDKTYILYLAADDFYLERMLELREYYKDKTVHQFTITSAVNDDQSKKDCLLDLVNHKYFRSLEFVTAPQVMCHYIPLEVGINPAISGDPHFHQALKGKFLK